MTVRIGHQKLLEAKRTASCKSCRSRFVLRAACNWGRTTPRSSLLSPIARHGRFLPSIETMQHSLSLSLSFALHISEDCTSQCSSETSRSDEHLVQDNLSLRRPMLSSHWPMKCYPPSNHSPERPLSLAGGSQPYGQSACKQHLEKSTTSSASMIMVTICTIRHCQIDGCSHGCGRDSQEQFALLPSAGLYTPCPFESVPNQHTAQPLFFRHISNATSFALGFPGFPGYGPRSSLFILRRAEEASHPQFLFRKILSLSILDTLSA